MAIYHLKAQVASRSKGQSAVAMAAYRSGERLTDERTGEAKFYRRGIQPETAILAPVHSPEWVHDRNRLWNEVEKAEKRKDSQLCREMNIAIPIEFSPEQQKRVVMDYCQKRFVDRGMIADIAIHRDDPDNPHAHVMLTMRDITPEGFGNKNREWNPEFAYGKVKDSTLFEEMERAAWAEHVNQEFERMERSERIDHRSFERQGITDRLPTIHEGPQVRKMEERGIETEIGNVNREVRAYNAQVIDLQKARQERAEQSRWKYLSTEERVKVKEAVRVCRGFVDFDTIDQKLSNLHKVEERTAKDLSYLKWKEDIFKDTQKLLHDAKATEHAISRSQSDLKSINWFNPMKYKENKETKERAESDIAYLEKQKSAIEKRMNYHKEKLGFTSEIDFYSRWEDFRKDTDDRIVKIQEVKNKVAEERVLLHDARKALENGEVRRIAEMFPSWENAKYMTYEQAVKMEEFSQKQITPSQMDKQHRELANMRSQIAGAISNLENEGTRLDRATTALDRLERATEDIKKHNKSVGKFIRFVSKEAKEEFEKATMQKEHSEQDLRQLGVTDRNDLYRQNHDFNRTASEELPKLRKNLSMIDAELASQTSILAIMRQVEARRQLEQQRERHKHREHERGRGR